VGPEVAGVFCVQCVCVPLSLIPMVSFARACALLVIICSLSRLRVPWRVRSRRMQQHPSWAQVCVYGNVVCECCENDRNPGFTSDHELSSCFSCVFFMCAGALLQHVQHLQQAPELRYGRVFQHVSMKNCAETVLMPPLFAPSLPSQRQLHWSSSNDSSSNIRFTPLSLQGLTTASSLTHLRGFRSSFSTSETMTIKIPPMGESVSEGTVAAILKHPGAYLGGRAKREHL